MRLIHSRQVDGNLDSMGALGCTEQARTTALGRPDNSVLSGSDRYGFAVSRGLDIANGWLAKEAPVLAIELACAFVADLERCTCRIHVIREHVLSRRTQAKLLLKLKRTHRSKGAKMVMQRRSAHARERRQLFHTKRFLVVRT
jgi:hypothetical protein